MDRDGLTRRAVLAAIGVGAATAGPGAPAAGRATGRGGNQSTDDGIAHVITINSPSDVPVEYTFTSSGPVEKSTDVPPGLPHDEATTDPGDVIDGRTVSGATQGGVDSYRYTGSITSFSATNCDEANVWVDDARIDACQYPDAGAAPSERVISLNSPSDERVHYEFAVASSVEASSAVPPGVPHDRATMDDVDEVDGRTVSGYVHGDVDTYVYDELVAFAIRTDDCDAANVWIDEEPVDACALDARLPDPGDEPGGAGDATVVRPPATIREPGTYALDGDVDAREASSGLDVRADGVTLDGRGHCVRGGDGPDSVGVRVAASDVTVENVCVEGWATCVEIAADGVELLDSTLDNGERGTGTGLVLSGASSCRIEGNDVLGSAVGIATRDTADCLLARNDVGTAGSEALAMAGSVDDEVRNNALRGITFVVYADRVRGTRFGRNAATGGLEDGFYLSRATDVVLAGNTAADNSVTGITLSASAGGELRDNAVHDNESGGVLLDGSTGASVTGNVVLDNGRGSDDRGGVTLFDADDNAVRRNVVCGNGAPDQIVVDDESTGNAVSENLTC